MNTTTTARYTFRAYRDDRGVADSDGLHCFLVRNYAFASDLQDAIDWAIGAGLSFTTELNA